MSGEGLTVAELDAKLAAYVDDIAALIERLRADPGNVGEWGMLRGQAAYASGLAWARHKQLAGDADER